jgi:hypothetical protein
LADALLRYDPVRPSDQERRFGYSMLQAGMDATPIQSPWQGAARLAQALIGGWTLNNAEDRAKRERAVTAFAG